MKSAKNKRQLTLLTLVLALGVAVYLNWEYAKSDQGGLPLADASQVNASTTQAIGEGDFSEETQGLPVVNTNDEPAADKNYGDAQLVSAGESTSDKYFEQARLTRSKTRDDALDKLQKALKNAKISEDEKKAATTKLTTEIESITNEADIESLVKAKGFIDCVAFINGEKVNLAVKTGGNGLGKTEVAQLRDIVLSKVATNAKNITIVEVK